jgi:DNA-binding cell septation regulator SpoVG
MPREQGKDSKWYDSIRPLNKETQQQIQSAVLSAYNAGDNKG